MIEYSLKYQATFFSDNTNIAPNPENMNSLIDIFRDDSLLPTIFQEFISSRPTPHPRIRLATVDNRWSISFASQRIDIDRNSISPEDKDIGSVSDFSNIASGYFQRILKLFPRKAHRLGLNTIFLLKELPEDQLSKIHSALFNVPPFYTENPPTEWDWRGVAKINLDILESPELINVITTIKRVQGEFLNSAGVTPIDRIQLSFDINTEALNSDYRFELSHIQDYLKNASEFHDGLCQQIQDYIGS